MRWVRQAGKLEENILLGRHRHKLEDSVKMNFEEIVLHNVD
jgi:hypothetical protein